ncbi:MAG TPA: hypothetical protein VLI94_00520 [Solirubrobacterales bacterium]|nr:hypothetical protein [Solirubrobacterales bacterium]
MTTAGRTGTGRALAILALSIVSLLIGTAGASAAAPANDAFAAAEALPDFPSEPSGSNAEATKEAGEPNHAGNPGGHSVWFSWTPSSNRRVGIQSGNCFGGPDMLIAVYTGPSVDSLTPVASNQSPAPPGCFFSEAPQAEFEATAGTTYWIAVDGRDGAQGAFNLRFSGKPDNDDFANATTVGAATPQDLFSTNKLGSKEAGEPDHAGDPGGNSVWFSWTPDVTEPVRIATCTNSSSLDAVLSVYTGSQLDALDEVAGNDETAIPLGSGGCRQSDSGVMVDAVAGTTYRIAVDGANGTAGRFNLLIEGRPVNDDFDSAQELLPGIPSFASNGSNEFATEESGEPNHAGNPGGRSVWFSWTAPSSGRVRIATCSPAGALDTILAVYTGADLAGATLVAANDEGSNGYCTYGSELAIDATAGTTYMIAVDGKDGDQGRFGVSIEAPPANDDFADAKALPETVSVSTSGSTTMGTKESGEPDHAGNPGGTSVWFSWTAPSSGSIAISTCPFFEESPDTLLAVYTGSTLGGLTPVAASDDSASACQEVGSEARFQAVAGTTYRIAVDSKGRQGVFSLEIGGRPANDTFASPEVLPAEPMMAGGSTLFTGKEAGEPNHAGNPGGHSVWFSWTPSSSGPVEVTACGRNGVDTLLAVYTGTAVTALTPVTSNDDVTGRPLNGMCESPSDSAVVLNAVAGTTYRIAVDTKDSEGRFGMGFIPAAGNDDFANADELYAGLPSFGSESTTFAGKEAGEPNHAGNPGGHSVWYRWTAPSSGPVLASTCTREGGFDTLLAVYTGSSVGSLTPVASGDDGQSRKGCSPTDSEAQFTATAGTTYRIAIDGKGGAAGSFQITLEGVAPNDDFGKAHPLGGGLPTAWQFTSNRFATEQAGEPDHAGDAGGSSVWFKWTAPRSGPVSVDTCGSGFDTLLAVYTGGTIAGLTPVQSNDNGSGWCSPRSKLSFEAVANATYRIAVDGKGGAQGQLELNVEERRANDDFAAAEEIPGRAGWYWPGSTVLATKQAGEPNHAGNPGGRSVWFSWTPRKSLRLELDACTEGFEPLLGVYTGAAVGALTPVSTSDKGSGECEEGSSVGFDAVAGTTYRFAVDGPGGDEGRFELHLRSVKASVTPPSEPPPTGDPGGGVVVPPVAGPTPAPQPKKPLKCKRGFKKKVVKGKARCVKKKKKKGKKRHQR